MVKLKYKSDCTVYLNNCAKNIKTKNISGLSHQFRINHSSQGEQSIDFLKVIVLI